MRTEVEYVIEQIAAGASVLDVGPMEGSEMQVLLDKGCQVTAVNVLGKTLIDGVQDYRKMINTAKFDVVIVEIGAGDAGNAVWYGKNLKDGGALYLLAPVDEIGGYERTRQYGRLRVLNENEDPLLGSKMEPRLVFTRGEGLAIINKEINRAGVWEYRKPDKKETTKIVESEAADGRA